MILDLVNTPVRMMTESFDISNEKRSINLETYQLPYKITKIYGKTTGIIMKLKKIKKNDSPGKRKMKMKNIITNQSA